MEEGRRQWIHRHFYWCLCRQTQLTTHISTVNEQTRIYKDKLAFCKVVRGILYTNYGERSRGWPSVLQFVAESEFAKEGRRQRRRTPRVSFGLQYCLRVAYLYNLTVLEK